ncbi:MAG TPA: hypothetical protein VHO91_16555 [Rhodopila sp.]|nr:hypothetical protein [Rhodopila sp.]
MMDPAFPNKNVWSGRPRFAVVVEQVRRHLCRERWNVGVIRQRADEIVRDGIGKPIEWLVSVPDGMLFADPACLLHPDGRRSFFVEAASCRGGRGEIWQAEVAPGEDPASARFAPVIIAGYHMSYPFPFFGEAGETFLTLESWQAGRASIGQLGDNGWNETITLIDGRPVIDPTLWRGPDRWWLFCTFRDDGPDSRLYLFWSEHLEGPWHPHRRNPIVTDPGRTRPAGPLFMADGRLIRPAQDCSNTYGGAVVLNWVRQLDTEAYDEEPVRRLDPQPGPYPAGLHTFCPAGDVTLVDGKTWTFDMIELAYRVAHKLRHRR